ncbi:MAG: hypothetical protein JWQ20_2902 [Conexibacter sp.]|nr:hypothetical protein [Conexibacter sp.]
MPFPPRPIDATLHGVIDYSAGTLLLTMFPRLAGIEGTRSARQVRTSAAIHAAYSTLTDYPLGIVKVLPFRMHLAIDAVGAIAVGMTPLVTGQYKKGRDQWVPHLALSMFELSTLALTDPTGKGDFHGNIEAVRKANMEDPRSKIYTGPRAVRPAAAVTAAAA